MNYPNDDSPITIILKVSNGKCCNLSCSYCYERNKNIDIDTYFTPYLLKKLLGILNGRSISVELHGGEPLVIGKENLFSILKVLNEYKGNIKLSLVTNGVLLNEEFYSGIIENWGNINFSLSLDGDEIDNKYRVDKNGMNSHKYVERAIDVFLKKNKKIGIMSTVHKDLLGREGEILEYFANKKCVNMVKFNPCFNYSDSKTIYISPNEYFDFLINIFNYWLSNPTLPYVIEPLFSIIRAIKNKQNSFCIYSDKKCFFALTFYPNGDLYFCDEMDIKDSFIGNIEDFSNINAIFETRNFKNICKKNDALLLKCIDCEIRYQCRGGCLAARERFDKKSLNYTYCDMQKDLFTYIGNKINLL